MADKLGLSGESLALAADAGSIMALLERVAGIMDNVQACQSRMEERQLELEAMVKTVQADVIKLTVDHTITSSTVDRLLDKTRKVSCHIKDVRVRVENQNLRVKKVEATQADLLAKNKFRVVIYQGEQEVPAVAAAAEPKEGGAEGGACPPVKAEIEPDKFELPPESDDEYMVVEEADSATARTKKAGLTRIESFKATFSRENMSKTRDNLGSKVGKLGERIVSTERREKIRQSGERLKHSGERLKESIAKSVPAKLNLKKERTVAEGQEGAEGATEGAAPVPPPKGRKSTPDPEPAYTEVAKEAADEGKAEEAEVPIYDMKQLS
ncbi:caveolae-associated protein 4b [Aplochiton taeniatus]